MSQPTPEQFAALRAQLDRMDRRAVGAPWTRSTLHLIQKYPGVVSTALARHAQQDRPAFKRSVQQLKDLGLTEQLSTGYRLTPLGDALLQTLG